MKSTNYIYAFFILLFPISMFGQITVTVDCIILGNGSSATIDRGIGEVTLQQGDIIQIGDIIETNSDRIQFSDNYGCTARLSSNALVEILSAPIDIQTAFPGLTYSAWIKEGEVLKIGLCDGKYRTSCYVAEALTSSIVFMKPGSSSQEDIYYSLAEPTEVWEYISGIWTQLFQLNANEKATLLSIGPDQFQLPATIQSISTTELDYINNNYLDETIWCVNTIPTVSQWGLIILTLLLLTIGSVSIIWQKQTKLITPSSTGLNLKTPLFNFEKFKEITLKSLPFIFGVISIISIVEGGIFTRNILGTVIGGLIISFLIQFVLMSQEYEKKNA